MKLIFLDIDGVLNHHQFYKKRYDEKKHEKTIKKDDGGKLTKQSEEDFYAEMLDPESIENLNELIEKTGAKVVVSSTWRLGKSPETLQATLEKRGFVGEIIDKTPRGCACCQRGNEILEWLKNNQEVIGKPYHEYNSYLILDDDSDMLYWQRNNFMWVDGHVGLTPTITYKAIRLLNGKD